jgi:hypothetical protein
MLELNSQKVIVSYCQRKYPKRIVDSRKILIFVVELNPHDNEAQTFHIRSHLARGVEHYGHSYQLSTGEGIDCCRCLDRGHKAREVKRKIKHEDMETGILQ